MESVPIDVQCYAGFKADESPRRFFWDTQWIEVEETLERWVQADRNPEAPLADYFKISDDDSHEYLLRHDRKTDIWFLENRC